MLVKNINPMSILPLLRRCAAFAKPTPASFVVGLLSLAAISTQASPPPGYNLVWADEFNGGVNAQPNSNNWGYDLGGGGWGNGELETYVNDWAHVHIISDSQATDGQALQIQATNANGYQSVRMKTQGKYSFKYGFIEARIKLPYGQGMWPAFWMLGTNIGTVGWPACGEMDIMENIGNNAWLGTNQASLHTPNHNSGNSLNSKFYLPQGSAFKDGYHLFQAQWSPGIVSFYIDNQWYETVTAPDDGGSWPFDNGNMFMILNCAIGGGWPGNPDGTTVSPQNMLVDYVRVYQNPNQPTNVTTSIKALANNLWVCADNYGNNPLIANRTSVGTWETYDVIDLGNHNIGLRAHANNLYVCADNAGSSPLIANRTAIGGWETYQVVPVPGGLALKAAANGLYVCADNYGNAPLIANRTSPSGWETFQFYLH